jgi:hypothetical protein
LPASAFCTPHILDKAVGKSSPCGLVTFPFLLWDLFLESLLV